MDKRKLKLYVFTFFFIIVSALLFRMNYSAYHKKNLQIGDKLPKVTYEYANRAYEVEADSAKPAVLLVYKSGCPYCEMTLKDIDENIKNSNQALFYFLSYDMNSDSTKNKYQNISRNLNAMFGKIDVSTLKDSLCVNAYPTVYIVDKNGLITEKVKGAIKFLIIESAINKCGVQGQNKSENVPVTAGDGKLN